MKMIKANVSVGIQCDWKGVYARETIDEVGFFRFNLSDSSQLIESGEGSTLVRSKVSGNDEGGVSIGNAVINSVCFADL